MKHILLAFSVLLVGCDAHARTVQNGVSAYSQNRVAEAETIFASVIADPAAAPGDKAAAYRETARIAWLIDRDEAKALQSADAAAATGEDVCKALLLRNRVLGEAKRARELLVGLKHNLARCTDPGDREDLYLQGVDAALALAAVGEAGQLERAQALLGEAGSDARKSLTGSALALEIGLLRGDAAAALQGWKDYFWLTDNDTPQALAGRTPAASTLFRNGLAVQAPVEARLALVDLLMRAGFARSIERFSRLHLLEAQGGTHPLWRKASAYLAERAKIEATILASNRRVARGGKASDLAAAMKESAIALMAAAGVGGDPRQALLQAYGLYGTVGETGGFASVHFGHAVQNETRTVEQYGHQAEVGFVAVDNMVSNGYESWLWDGSAAAGGWTEAGPVMVQVRPEYTSDPLRTWRLATDPKVRGELQARQQARAAADRVRLSSVSVAYLPSLGDRLRIQIADQVAARARELAAEGGDLRTAFLEEYWRAILQQSIFVHEGRHALDRKLITGLGRLNDTNLEYRAKLSELALSDYPKLALLNINADTIGGGTAHGKANEKIMAAYAKWIQANRRHVSGFDPATPALMQLDKLSDAQIKAVARSLDPIAR